MMTRSRLAAAVPDAPANPPVTGNCRNGKRGDLEQRIASALTDTVGLDVLDALIGETQQAIASAEEEAEAEHKRSFDIVAAPEPKAARDAAADATHRAHRLHAAIPRLQTRYRQIIDAQNYAAWRARRDKLEVKRDALAKEFAATYPEIEKRLVDVLTSMAALDAEIYRLNEDAPDGTWSERLDGPELVARGLQSFGFGRDTPSIQKALRLPTFGGDGHLAWPPGLYWGRGVN